MPSGRAFIGGRLRRVLLVGVGVAAISLVPASGALADTTIGNTPPWNGSTITSGFGVSSGPCLCGFTPTYGQTVTVPATDTNLDSFTFYADLPTNLTFRGEVYAWNPATVDPANPYSMGSATGPALYESGPMHTTSYGAGSAIHPITVNIPGGLPLTAGAQYVLFFTTSRDYAANAGITANSFFGYTPTDTYSGGDWVYVDDGGDPGQWTAKGWTHPAAFPGCPPCFSQDDLAFKASFSPPPPLYAAAAAIGSGSCSDAADACTLSTALGQVAAGGTIELVTPGGTGYYVGNWAVSTPGTSASQPVTIEPAPGVSDPVLDGNNGSSTGCSTAPSAPCNGPVLTVPGGEYVALSGITIADGNNTSTAFGAGGLDNAGTVTIAGSTFTDNTGSGDGGAIGNANGAGLGGTGSVTVTASTFTANTAGNGGGAINNSQNGGTGSVTVTASTFAGNTASGNGGAIVSGGGGSVTVTASTFTANTASLNGGAIASGDSFGGGTVQVAGDVFDGTCYQASGATWTDGGYNAGSDGSCFQGGTGNVNAGSSSALGLGSLASNGGPTQTIEPGPVSPATVIGLIPGPTTVTLGGTQVQLCPATDQRGYHSAAGAACDAGAVQTSGGPPALTLKDTVSPGSFNAAGQVLTYSYQVSNTGAGPLAGITVTDPAVPGVSCPSATLAAGTSEVCTGSYAITDADLAAGQVTDTATATGTAGGVPVASNTATVTVAKGWPPVVSGTYRPAPGVAEGYYLGVTNNTWQLLVTHPGTTKVAFTGRISVPAGTLGHLTLISPSAGHHVTITGKAITFTLPNYGKVTGFSFTTTPAVTSITLTLDIGGHPATATQIYLGATPAQAATSSPLTFTR
jgi:predicted outer membrane repeat protein